jgi:hypothetical protein
MIARRVPRSSRYLAILAAALACTTPTGDDSSRQAVRVQLASLSSSVSVPLTAPYVSVIDSINLVVTSMSTGRRQEFGQHLLRRDTDASFPIEVDTGSVQFAARVLSNNRTVLFSASPTVRVASGSFDAITVDLTPSTGVLLVSPDSTPTTFLVNPASGEQYNQLAVHNRGTGSLAWSIRDTLPPASTSQCPLNGCVRFFPSSGAVVAGQPVTIQVIKNATRVNTFTTAITFVFTSTVGDVPVVVRPF